MDSQVMMIRACSWSRFIEERASSGKTVKEFCNEHNVATSTYYKWQKAIRDMMLESSNTFGNPATADDKTQFAEISVPLETGSMISETDPSVEINVDSVTIKLTNSVSPELLENLWKVIRKC